MQDSKMGLFEEDEKGADPRILNDELMCHLNHYRRYLIRIEAYYP
jgi:hypothetical protein